MTMYRISNSDRNIFKLKTLTYESLLEQVQGNKTILNIVKYFLQKVVPREIHWYTVFNVSPLVFANKEDKIRNSEHYDIIDVEWIWNKNNSSLDEKELLVLGYTKNNFYCLIDFYIKEENTYCNRYYISKNKDLLKRLFCYYSGVEEKLMLNIKLENILKNSEKDKVIKKI